MKVDCTGIDESPTSWPIKLCARMSAFIDSKSTARKVLVVLLNVIEKVSMMTIVSNSLFSNGEEKSGILSIVFKIGNYFHVW
jgi:hypothetical protein